MKLYGIAISDDLTETGKLSSTLNSPRNTQAAIDALERGKGDSQSDTVNASARSRFSGGLARVAADTTGNALSADDFLANWAAPEVIRGAPHSQKSDMYSIAFATFFVHYTTLMSFR